MNQLKKKIKKRKLEDQNKSIDESIKEIPTKKKKKKKKASKENSTPDNEDAVTEDPVVEESKSIEQIGATKKQVIF